MTSQILLSLNDISSSKHSIGLNLIVPPILDVARLSCRTVVTCCTEKLAPFPSFQELFQRLITIILKKQLITIVHLEVANIKIDIEIEIPNQTTFCLALNPLYKPCKKRKGLKPTEHEFQVSRKDCGMCMLDDLFMIL